MIKKNYNFSIPSSIKWPLLFQLYFNGALKSLFSFILWNTLNGYILLNNQEFSAYVKRKFIQIQFSEIFLTSFLSVSPTRPHRTIRATEFIIINLHFSNALSLCTLSQKIPTIELQHRERGRERTQKRVTFSTSSCRN